MESDETESENRTDMGYCSGGGPPRDDVGKLRIIAPFSLPEFNPEAARAILRLLSGVNGRRSKDGKSEIPEEE
jgi:hypothetical protein